MRLTLATNDGELLDTAEVSVGEFRRAQVTCTTATSVLGMLYIPDNLPEDS